MVFTLLMPIDNFNFCCYQEEITRVIQFLCAHLPSTVADMCIDFVEQYGDELFELLTSEIAPKAVCTQMGLCWGDDKSHKLLGHKNEKETALEVTGWKLPSKCEICEIVIEYLDKLLADDTIEASIDHIIEKACTVVPRGAQDKVIGITKIVLSHQYVNGFPPCLVHWHCRHLRSVSTQPTGNYA